MTFAAGAMQNRIAIQALTDTVTASGGTSDTWTTVKTVWARVEPIAGREYFREQALHGDTTHRVTMRYQKDVTRKHRVLHKGRAFDVLSVINREELGIDTILLCKERDT